MPERRLERARRSLPDGYRFGDARPKEMELKGAEFVDEHGDRWVIGEGFIVAPSNYFTSASILSGIMERDRS